MRQRPVRLRWGRIQAVLVRELEATALEQLAEETNQLFWSPPGRMVINSTLVSAE